MATLTVQERRQVRNFLEKKAVELGVVITYPKGAPDAAAQAVEDFLEQRAAQISTAIDNATQPFGVTYTAAQKRFIVAVTLFVKYLRDRV